MHHVKIDIRCGLAHTHGRNDHYRDGLLLFTTFDCEGGYVETCTDESKAEYVK